MSSPTRRNDRAFSPLRSPVLRRHLSREDIGNLIKLRLIDFYTHLFEIFSDIHYPAQFLQQPILPKIYKQTLIGEDGTFRAVSIHR